jgi:hypothetical protein
MRVKHEAWNKNKSGNLSGNERGNLFDNEGDALTLPLGFDVELIL